MTAGLSSASFDANIPLGTTPSCAISINTSRSQKWSETYVTMKNVKKSVTNKCLNIVFLMGELAR